MGYAVVMVDFHGSTGYGEAFTEAIVGHWGDRPLEDLQKGWAAAQAKYPWLDGNRACALGGSYGGYMVDWIAGNWNGPWKCLVDHDGVFDTRMMAYATDIPGFRRRSRRFRWLPDGRLESEPGSPRTGAAGLDERTLVGEISARLERVIAALASVVLAGDRRGVARGAGRAVTGEGVAFGVGVLHRRTGTCRTCRRRGDPRSRR